MENTVPQTKIKEAIIKTVAFFDLFDYPLTVDEIWKYLWLPDSSPMDPIKLKTILALPEIQTAISSRNNFYFLAGRESIVEVRRVSLVYTRRKIRRARFAARILKYFVGVKMMAAVNSVVLGSVKKESDIDLFIVVARERMWLSRLMVTALIHVFGLRRHGKKITNRLCLSFYVTEDHLDIGDVMLERDPYFCYWLATLAPIYDDGCYENFIRMNSWLKKFLPNFFVEAPARFPKAGDSIFSRLTKYLDGLWYFSFIGAWCEVRAKRMQLKKMAGNLNSLASFPDSRVVVSDTMLKFHEFDRREEFRNQWEEKYMPILEKL